MIAPPYSSDEQRAFVAELRDHSERRFGTWSEVESRRYFLAGGGAEAEFAAHFEREVTTVERMLRAVEDGRYHGILGGPFYLVGGRKGD